MCAELYTLYMSEKMSELQINVQVRILFSPLKKTDPSGFMALVRRERKIMAVLCLFFFFKAIFHCLGWCLAFEQSVLFYFILGNSVTR